jgi:hypothetical protein
VAACQALFARLGLDSHFEVIGRTRKSPSRKDTVLVMLANHLTEPRSKRRTIKEWLGSVALPKGVAAPSLDQCYRAVDALVDAKESTEAHLYSRLRNLANLDVRLVCHDLTSCYCETEGPGSPRFTSLSYGYSRDQQSDRAQVVIGLLVTGDRIPIAHNVFSGNTSDVSTLPSIMEDL